MSICLFALSLAAYGGEIGAEVRLPPKAEAPAEAEPDDMSPGPLPGALTPAADAENLRAERKALNRQMREKLRQAELLLQVKRLQECIVLCDEVLAEDPGNLQARMLKAQAVDIREQAETANIDAERHMRDQVALREVTRDGLIPHRGPDLPRPVISAEEMPFAEEARARERMRMLLGQRIPEINLAQADLNYVLQILFKTTGVNIVYDPNDVQGVVTIHARDLTLEDVLKYLCRNCNIGYILDRGTVWVYSSANDRAANALLKTEIIPIRYGLVRAGGSSLSAADGNQPGGNQPAARSQTEGSQAGVEESDIEALLSWMEANWPGWPPQTKWRLDKKFNRLIICSTPDIIDEVKKMVAMLDVPPIQILISTRFVMVRENALDKLGFNWTLTPNPAMMPSKTRPGDQRKDWRDEKTRITTMQSNTGVAADAFAAGAVGVLNNHQLDFAMQALKSATGSKTLTAPRVVALNNKIAEIHLFDAYPYIETYQQQVSTITTDQTVQQAVTLIPQWQTKQLGHHLTVLPSVGADMKTISLRVTPRIDKVTGEVPRYIVVSNPDGTQRTVEWSYPIFTTDTLTAEAVPVSYTHLTLPTIYSV